MKKFLFRRFDAIHDFYLLGILATIMILICSITFLISDYFSFRSEVESAVKEQNDRARNQFSESLVHTKYITESIGKQILIHSASHRNLDYNFIDSLLVGYRNLSNELISWSTFSWSDKDYNLVVSSNIGIMKEPIDMSKRDYMPLTKQYPYQVHMGKPVIGVVSKLWSIPAGYGVVDQRGKYLGSVVTGIVVDGLRNRISSSMNDINVAFAIVDRKGEVLAKSDGFDLDKAKKFLNRLKPEVGQKIFQYGDGFYQKIDDYPYGIVTFYRSDAIKQRAAIRLFLYMICASVIVFMISFAFLIVYRNLIAPVFQLSAMAAKISRGEKLPHPVPEYAISEINELAKIVRSAAKHK